MKELTKTLQEKYLNETKNEKAKLSRFLKRRRIELGKTLEEVSEGVCSTSYLSKIENCLVDVDDSYFKMLFEKLNLEYNNVVNERSAPIYDEMIKAYLLEDYKYIEELTNTAIENHSYSDTEIEILLILYNLTIGSIDEAKKCLEKLEVIKNTLSTDELEYLSFFKILYYFKTYQYNLISKHIEIILNSVPYDGILYFALLEMVLEYCFVTNQVVNFIEYYNEFKENKYSIMFSKINFKHVLQRILIKSYEKDFNVKDIEAEFEVVKASISSDMMDEYQYYYAVYLIKQNKLEQAYLILEQLTKEEKVLCLIGYTVDKMNNMGYSLNYLKELEEFDYEESTPYSDYIEYVRLKLEQYSYGQLYNFLKNRVLERQNVYKHYYLNEIETNEFYYILFELGKYKEIAKHILNK